MMRNLLAAVMMLGVVAQASALSVKHVEPRKMEEGDYRRVGEFFGHERKNPTRVELHAQEAPQNGMAWVVELDKDIDQVVADSDAVGVKLAVLFKGERHERVFDFDLTSAKLLDTKTLYLGVGAKTAGADSNDDRFPNFLAWKVTFVDGEGEEVVAAPSTLWAF